MVFKTEVNKLEAQESQKLRTLLENALVSEREKLDTIKNQIVEIEVNSFENLNDLKLLHIHFNKIKIIFN